ncbi:hypothetical protein Rhal01_01197 [Rubritalea halochordaticola]|uniref:Sulfatase N-terminal domain-containing protein n=1 Tax=Rubritalea halochordaticola TaxID=714537 RepID=A0ABP9UXD7_9BACT
MLKLLTHLLLTATTLLPVLSSADETPQPNIVYIYADDLGWGYIGANGQTQVKTPNLNALADSGVNFTRGYGCTVCSPARSSQQTGFHQGHTWTDRNDPDSSKAIRSDDTTIGDALKSVGYRTAYFGKWGYGADSAQNDPAINNPQTLPINHGYDIVLAELHHVRAHTFFQPTLWRSNTDDETPTTALVPNTIPNDATLPTYPAYQNDPGYPSTAYCDDSYAFAALDFVRSEAQDTSKPFFCLLAFQIPHTPLGNITSLPKWFDEYNDVAGSDSWPQDSKEFAAMVTRMDAHIGNLLAALEDPNNDGDKSDSVLDNTLIVFASDNGGQSSGEASSPLSFFSGNSNLRGAKGNIYEGAIRVPMLMKWQGKLAAGSTSSQVVDVTDMLPTFCELAGADIPVGLDGVSLAPTITGEGHQRTRDFIIHEAGSKASIIRGNYKLVKDGGYALYDLDSDPSESTDISASHTDLVNELTTLLLGERVTEPDNFANTYHTWTGADEASTSNASNWSDYDYSNNGTSYLSDSGSPQASWSTKMENTNASDNTAVADANIETLGIEIEGDSHLQILNLSSHTLTGRNEIRIGAKGKVSMENGTLDSLRWVDLQNKGEIEGSGTINATFYHSGTYTNTPTTETTIPGNGVELIQNGGFESGADTGGGDYSYTTLENWTTDGSSPNNDGAKPNNAKTGTYRGLIEGNTSNSNLVQNTGTSLLSGDAFTISFWHRGFSGWSTGEEAKVSLYYLDNSNNPVEIFDDTFALTNGTWVEASYTTTALSDSNAVGKNLYISLSPANGASGFASFDDVSLSRQGEEVTVPSARKLVVTSNYHASETASTVLSVAGKTTAAVDYTQIQVAGSAALDGSLSLDIDPSFTPSTGDTFTVLTADSITGKYAHADDIINVGDHFFKITYNAQNVVLEKIAATANGTPHSWLDDNGLNSGDYDAADLEDSDNDGQPNWKEFISGTDPNSPSSVIGTIIQPEVGANGLTLSWDFKPNRLYYVETSTDLTNYITLDGPFSGEPSTYVYSIPNDSEGSRFYRIRVARR